MKKHIAIENKQITYTLRKSARARRMRIAVYCDGSVVVTTPFDLRDTVVERFLREKAHWLFAKMSFFRQFEGRAVARRSNADYLKHKDDAYRIVAERVNYFNKIYGFSFNQINIKNQKTRWGSCSRKGNLNFNYKIVFLPQQLSDYIIVHELCHLREFNHSRKFWSLVERGIPDYLGVRNELKKSGVIFD